MNWLGFAAFTVAYVAAVYLLCKALTTPDQPKDKR